MIVEHQQAGRWASCTLGCVASGPMHAALHLTARSKECSLNIHLSCSCKPTEQRLAVTCTHGVPRTAVFAEQVGMPECLSSLEDTILYLLRNLLRK